MVSASRIVALLSLLILTVVSGQATEVASDSQPAPRVLLPSEDPWYSTPWESHTTEDHGVVWKTRDSPGNITSVLKHCKESVQILFSTKNSLNRPTFAVTTVLVPKVPAKAKWNKNGYMVSYQFPYDSASLDDSPSYSLSIGSNSIRLDIVDRMLDRGWYVNIPDYEGPNAAFAAPAIAGKVTIDSLRAVLSIGLQRFGLDPEAAIGLWGYSGGAVATAWAYLIRKKYDTKLWRLVAVSIGGLPLDMIKVLKKVDGTSASGLIFNAISGLMTEYPPIMERVIMAGKDIGPFNVTAFDAVRNMTFFESMTTFAFHNISDYFIGGLGAVLTKPIVKLFYEDMSLSELKTHSSTITGRFYVYHGIEDELAPIEDVDELVSSWCWTGQYAIDYHRNIFGGHVEVGHAGIDNSLAFIAEQFRQGWWVDSHGAKFLPFPPCRRKDIALQSSFQDMDNYNGTSGGSAPAIDTDSGNEPPPRPQKTDEDENNCQPEPQETDCENTMDDGEDC